MGCAALRQPKLGNVGGPVFRFCKRARARSAESAPLSRLAVPLRYTTWKMKKSK